MRDLLSSAERVVESVAYVGAFVMIIVALLYLLFMTISAKRRPDARRVPADRIDASIFPGPKFQIVVLMPCLNEATVIRASVERLLAEPDPTLSIIVIDDGSNDATSEVVKGIADPRIKLLRRRPPNARQGKGAALNEALGLVRRHFVDSDPRSVIVGVMDADGRLDPTAWSVVREAFTQAPVGAVQLGVRIDNRASSLLARMQDIEFVTFTSLFQMGRRSLGTVGMGGNAQFVRLSALNALGERPWSTSLTEDFDLGVRLNATCWVNEFTGEASVHQEGVTSMRRFIRQRTRWFQGNLQARHLLGMILHDLRGRARADTLWQVLSPYLLLLGSLLTLSFLIALGVSAANLVTGVPQSWAWVPIAYLLAFGPAFVYTKAYWHVVRTEDIGFVRSLLWCHLFVLYGLLIGVYGWRALFREITGRGGWAKTVREDAVAASSEDARS